MRRMLLGIAATVTATAVTLVAGTAQAGYKMEIDETRWISLGIGARIEVGSRDDGIEDRKNFNVDSIRPYLSGQIHEYIKWEANFDYDSRENDLQLLDGVVKFEFNDYLNVWAGRFLPPTDRANFSGPYYLNTWAFPTVAQRYPAIFAGRDNGIVAWGQLGEGKFKYQFGMFEGLTTASAPQYNARFVVSLLDPEPGYYNASTYFGEKDILTIGATVYAQKDGAGTDLVGEEHDFLGWNVDLLFEKSFGDAGTTMLDAAYYSYDNDGFPVGTGSPRADGDAYYVTLGWYLPGEFGAGSFKGLLQPHVRYQHFDNEDSGIDEKRWDTGINWYLDGYNAKLILYYSKIEDAAPGGSRNAVNLGFQFQF